MTITRTALTAGATSDPTFSDSSASITPSANKLVLCVIETKASPGNTPTAPALSGNGLTWAEVVTIISSDRMLTLFRALGASPTAGAVTINYNEQQTGTRWRLLEMGNVDTSGSNGSGAVVQSASEFQGTTSTPDITLAAFGSATNGALAVMAAYGAFVDLTEGSGWTLDFNTSNGVLGGLGIEWRADSDTSVDGTWSASSNGQILAIEIKEAAAAGGAPPFDSPVRGNQRQLLARGY